MRKELKKYNGQRLSVTAIFERFGSKNGWHAPQKTILLKDIKYGDELLTDHIWFTCGKTFESLDLVQGDVIQFDARVNSYTKGYQGYREDVYSYVGKDYRLTHPTKAKKIEVYADNLK